MRDFLADRLEGAVSGLFGPDAVLPEQFYGSGKPAEMTGEQALQWAVLADGITSYIRLVNARSAAARRELARLRVWIMRSDWDWLYSFVNLCTTFGFDPNAVREALARLDRGENPPDRRRRYRHAA